MTERDRLRVLGRKQYLNEIAEMIEAGLEDLPECSTRDAIRLLGQIARACNVAREALDDTLWVQRGSRD